MMDINEIIKPENKVYGKTPILKDNILHYCQDAPYSHTTIWTSTGSRQPTDVLPPSPQPPRG